MEQANNQNSPDSTYPQAEFARLSELMADITDAYKSIEARQAEVQAEFTAFLIGQIGQSALLLTGVASKTGVNTRHGWHYTSPPSIERDVTGYRLPPGKYRIHSLLPPDNTVELSREGEPDQRFQVSLLSLRATTPEELEETYRH